MSATVLGLRACRQGHALPLWASAWSSYRVQPLWALRVPIHHQTYPVRPLKSGPGRCIQRLSLKCDWWLHAALIL